MEFNEKLAELRKQKGITQEELADALFVSRTAISKWESGRGYPNIESLKALSGYFSISIDELLSGDEILTIASEDNKQSRKNLLTLVFGLLDLSVIIFFFLPLFGQKSKEVISVVSLLNLFEIGIYLKTVYIFISIALILTGLLNIVLQNFSFVFWEKVKIKLSIILNIIGTVVFIISNQPYAASLLFVFLILKVLLLIKR